jgi:tyrosine-protein kinase Etk/Wzc
MKSRSLADSVVYYLGAQGDAEREAAIRKILARGTDVRGHSDGSTSIDVTGADPALVAQIASEFPASVNRIATSIGSQAARQKMEFLEGQLTGARERLLQSEQALIEFQQLQSAPEIQEQTRRTMEAAAELQSRIIEKEIQVAQLRRTATPDNPSLRAAAAELNSVREQLRRLTAGTRAGDQLFLSLEGSPELKTSAARLVREFTKNEQVYVSLTAALTEVQIDANNNLPVVTVLDPATVPQLPSGPKVGLLLGLFAFLGLLIGLIAAFLSEYAKTARRNPHNESFFVAWNQFKGELWAFMPQRWRQRLRAPVRG